MNHAFAVLNRGAATSASSLGGRFGSGGGRPVGTRSCSLRCTRARVGSGSWPAGSRRRRAALWIRGGTNAGSGPCTTHARSRSARTPRPSTGPPGAHESTPSPRNRSRTRSAMSSSSSTHAPRVGAGTWHAATRTPPPARPRPPPRAASVSAARSRSLRGRRGPAAAPRRSRAVQAAPYRRLCAVRQFAELAQRPAGGVLLRDEAVEPIALDRL